MVQAATGASEAAPASVGLGTISNIDDPKGISSSRRPGAKVQASDYDELSVLLDLLPLHIQELVHAHPEFDQILELAMDIGRIPIARFPSGDAKLGSKLLTREELDSMVKSTGDFGGDNRAGLPRTLHRISCIRNRAGEVIGLTARVGRAVAGSAQLIEDVVRLGDSVLLLGCPGVGKTTAIRDISGEDLKRVVVVDTSNEIGGDGDVAHAGLG
eukprot:CAMPEP_0114307906 /NCGR_PEP_ID=MMETSP0059-20121206/17744_1 /TAXON_ID=36894 /ORGANISM="Pyramimonas parkeae, Strain CCMP726" /LENGTH=213 /DNA_ID=CAMNT_0001431451 /DNA_START=217 /DNA_END=855 /DNA_ORIENTATION=-